MGTSGYEYYHEERVSYEDGKPVRHVKIVKRELSPEEAERVIEEDRKIWRDFDDAFQDFDQMFRVVEKDAGNLGFPFNAFSKMMKSMKHAFGALRAHLGKRHGGSDGQ